MKSPFEATITINFMIFERVTRLANIALQQVLRDPFQKADENVLRDIEKARKDNDMTDKWLIRRFK